MKQNCRNVAYVYIGDSSIKAMLFCFMETVEILTKL